MNPDDQITLRRDALNHISATDIVIRENKTFRLVFRPELIPNHPRVPEAKVGGVFICQRKRPSGEWEDYSELNLTNLRDTEWVKLDISSEEMLGFLRRLLPLYGIPVTQIVGGRYTRVRAEEIPQLEAVLNFIRDGNSMPDVLAAINLKTVRDLRDLLQANMGNNDEGFWHETFKSHTWVLGQLFSLPSVLLGDKVYVGGKRFDRRGGNEIDYILRNPVTRNIGIVEIKTPVTSILGSLYRNNTYSMSPDLTGGINQLLVAKIAVQRDYQQLFPQRTRALNPKCVLLIGKVEHLGNVEKRNLEIFRTTLKEVDVITYDELKEKLGAMIILLTSNNAS